MSSQVLIVDDEQDFRETLADLLTREGYLVEMLDSAEALRRRLEEGGSWPVVLLDERLRGGGGPEIAAGLAREVLDRDRTAYIMVVTAYASPQLIEKGFAAGVWDYLEKDGNLSALLRAKVRIALDLHRSARWWAQPASATTEELQARWAEARVETDSNRKGRLLEEIIALFFRSTPGFASVHTNVSNGLEEIDVTVLNRSEDPYLAKLGPELAVECKNWSTHIAPREVYHFAGKLKRHQGVMSFGLLVAPGGATPEAREALRHPPEGVWMVLVDGPALERLIQAADPAAREAALCDLIGRQPLGPR